MADELTSVAGAWKRARILFWRARREVARRHGVRAGLAQRFLSGEGLEIGALHRPLLLPRDARVRYVDRMTAPDLREHYPELADWPIVTPDLIADGERLEGVSDASVDFVIANHMIEHCEDPLGTLHHHQRVLRPGGILFMAVPDKRITFDRDRPPTPLDHLVRDHQEGPAWSRRMHYEEWARLHDRVPEEQVSARAAELDEQGYSIHFHVFTPHNFVEMVLTGRARLGLELELETCVPVDDEFIVVLRRTS